MRGAMFMSIVRPPRNVSRAAASNPQILLRFVVKKHASRRLHYDFRIEWMGVLISFVIEEGPSADPQIKRIAIHVDDHDPKYIDSERQIPQGEYGAGTVMVWDIGIWSPCCADPTKALREGRLEFCLYGKRMRGRWILERIEGQWYLTKATDEYAQPGNPTGLIDTYTNSATTGLTMEEIREGKSGRENQDDQQDFWD